MIDDGRNIIHILHLTIDVWVLYELKRCSQVMFETKCLKLSFSAQPVRCT